MMLGWWCGEIDTHVHHRDLVAAASPRSVLYCSLERHDARQKGTTKASLTTLAADIDAQAGRPTVARCFVNQPVLRDPARHMKSSSHLFPGVTNRIGR